MSKRLLDIDPVPCAADQRSEAWFAARRGVATASQFHRIVHSDGSPDRMAWESYANDILAEEIAPDFPRWKGNADTKRGEENEIPYLRLFSETTPGAAVLPAPFYRRGAIGASPDGFLCENGRAIAGLEVKSPRPGKMVQWCQRDAIPPEHKAQVHGGMIVTGLERWYFIAGCQGFSLRVILCGWNEYTDQLARTLEEFGKYYAGFRELNLKRCRTSMPICDR